MIIGLTGYKQVGKSTAASYLENTHGFARHNMKDALIREMKGKLPDTLQQLALCYYGLDANVKPRHFLNKLFKEKPPIMRALMQNYGTEVRRSGDPDYWTRRWKDTLPDGNVVVDDVRFMNEAEAVREAGGIIVRIERSDISFGGHHSSETEQDGIIPNAVIYTEPGGFDDLERHIEEIYKNI